MKILFILALILVVLPVQSQNINKTIILQLNQSPLLQVDAGDDLNLSEDGQVVIGQFLSVNGGTPIYSYEWKDESGNKFLEKTPVVNQTGQYWLKVTDQNNCWAHDSLSVMDYGTGLNGEVFCPSEKISIDDLQKTISIDIPEVCGKVRIIVLSLDGRIIYSSTMSVSQIMTFHHLVELGEKQRGIYLLRIQFGERELVKKFVLQ